MSQFFVVVCKMHVGLAALAQTDCDLRIVFQHLQSIDRKRKRATRHFGLRFLNRVYILRASVPRIKDPQVTAMLYENLYSRQETTRQQRKTTLHPPYQAL